jgi:hypothetical protein
MDLHPYDTVHHDNTRHDTTHHDKMTNINIIYL